MDPISVAASFVGLLGAAAKISSILNSVVRSARTAPKLARNTLIEVNDITVCLNQLQTFLLRTQTTHRSQESLVLVDQVLVILSDCVLIFSELEQTLDPLAIEEPWQAYHAFHRFQGLDAMIYVVSLPSYCQTIPGPSSRVVSSHHLVNNDHTDARDQRTRCRSP